MATYNGREARVTVNSDATEAIVTELGNWAINMTAGEIDTTAFGSGWSKSDVGMKKWDGSLTGNLDTEDTTGQDILEAAYLAGTLLGDIRFYVQYSDTSGDTVIFYEPDLATDPAAGARITAFNVTQDKSGVATLNVSFSGSGPLVQTTEVLP